MVVIIQHLLNILLSKLFFHTRAFSTDLLDVGLKSLELKAHHHESFLILKDAKKAVYEGNYRQ
jgi:hypothetical protein